MIDQQGRTVTGTGTRATRHQFNFSNQWELRPAHQDHGVI
jgi:hypothetical protein